MNIIKAPTRHPSISTSGCQEFVEVDEQTQRKEHHDLHQPGEAVEEDRKRPLLRQLIITQDQTGQIDGQISVATDQVGKREGKENEGKQKHRVKRIVAQVNAVNGPYADPTDSIPHQTAEKHLNDELYDTHRYAHGFCAAGQYADQHNGQHVRHRVVRTALQLQQRAQVLVQPLFLASQDGENRSRIRRRHRRGQQQRRRKRYGQPDPWGNERDETRYDHRRHDDSGGRQYDTRSDHRSYFRKLGIHTAREKDDTKSDHTYELGRFDGMERNEIDAEQHTDPQKKEQGRGAETIGRLAGHYSDEKKQGSDQQNVFGRNDIMHRKSLYKFTKKCLSRTIADRHRTLLRNE